MPSFAEYVTARWAALLRVAHLLTGDSSSAEDLVQATLVKVYVAWARVARADSVDAYVRKMLLNEFLGQERRSARRAAKAPLVVLSALTTVAPPDPAEDRLDLWAAVRGLPPRQRAVLVLRYYEDLTEAEIAHVLGISAGTVKSQAHAALRTLRGRLDPDSESEVTP